ncbi:MAG: hypothetical protein JXA33_00400 [Anaerolineae bacterium]|nr:hypothetical protein [Anaerolineae bacterium]
MQPLIVAHCGDRRNAPESTPTAFSSAIDKGADAIEFDVHLTKDGYLLIHHNYYLGRTENGNGYIEEHSFQTLRELDIGSWFDPDFASERMLTLEEVLTLGRGKVRFEIDQFSTDKLDLALRLRNIHNRVG